MLHHSHSFSHSCISQRWQCVAGLPRVWPGGCARASGVWDRSLWDRSLWDGVWDRSLWDGSLWDTWSGMRAGCRCGGMSSGLVYVWMFRGAVPCGVPLAQRACADLLGWPLASRCLQWMHELVVDMCVHIRRYLPVFRCSCHTVVCSCNLVPARRDQRVNGIQPFKEVRPWNLESSQGLAHRRP